MNPLALVPDQQVALLVAGAVITASLLLIAREIRVAWDEDMFRPNLDNLDAPDLPDDHPIMVAADERLTARLRELMVDDAAFIAEMHRKRGA